MKSKLVNIAAANHRDTAPALHCNVVVEASRIDFLTEDAVFVAGSAPQDCGCGISPMPQPRRSNRRSLVATKR